MKTLKPTVPRVRRSMISLVPDARRVIARPFLPGGEERNRAIVERVLRMSEEEVHETLQRLLRQYGARHRRLEETWERHFRLVAGLVPSASAPDAARRRLVGAYFTSEFSFESVSLFNPSMVPHFDQDGCAAGETRFILSLRALGEGHLSSIEFRTGRVTDGGEVLLDPAPPFAETGRPVADKPYDKQRFFRKLIEMGAYNPLADTVLSQLPARFTLNQLRRAVARGEARAGYDGTYEELARHMIWLAQSDYRLTFPEETPLTERVIFPVSENESRGIEDARFVRFLREDGSAVYYATYTAYNGFRVLPQLLETTDFRRFEIHTLNGRCVQNKGMALFPRRLGGWYWMVARMDGENIYLLRSDNLQFWNESFLVRGPVHPWEFVQIGNCGSPIETEAGWVLLTHGVGPMREYWLGALLLDRDDPTQVRGHLPRPLMVPGDDERDGYVPNVLYSCGAMRHDGHLVIPYALADTATRFAVVSLDELLAAFAPV